MLEVFKAITAPNFQTITIEKKEDLWTGFRSFMMRDQIAAESLGEAA